MAAAVISSARRAPPAGQHSRCAHLVGLTSDITGSTNRSRLEHGSKGSRPGGVSPGMEGIAVGVRVSKSFKVAPGVRLRVNAKSTSISLGGKGMRYTVNSKGRRTTTVGVPGTGVSVRRTSGTRRKAPSRAAAASQPARARSAPASPPKPGLFAPKGEKRLYDIVAGAQGVSADVTAARCEQVATRFPRQRIAALTLAGLFALSTDRAMAIRTLGEVFASRVEIADDEFLRRHAPVKSFPMRANGRDVAVPLSRDLIGMRLVQLHALAREFDWAESAAAELNETPVAEELRRMLAASQGNAAPGRPPATGRSEPGNGSPWGHRPAWMQDGVQAALLVGYEDLEVVGESHYQDNLRRLTGYRRPDEHVRQEIHAVLGAEDDNPYDPNAVAVWIDGLQVGHLSRDDARRYRPGLLEQQRANGKPIALAGVIAGGGIRADGPGMLGVFLRHDPADFGYRPQPAPPPPGARMRTALSDALATDTADDSYDLAWMADLPGDDIRAIPVLRKLLGTETSMLSRHYVYQHLEAALYRSRNAFASALGEYDETCRQHDAEMDAIRQACIAKWGKVPRLDTYRQMAIRQQKTHDYRRALWWAERGLSIYGSDCARPEDVEDLRQRAASYRAKVSST